MSFILILLSPIPLYFLARLSFEYFYDGADRRVATTSGLFALVSAVCILHSWALKDGSNIYIEYITAWMMFLIPFTSLKNVILFSKYQRFSKNTRCVLFLLLQLFYVAFIFNILLYPINQTQMVQGISDIVNLSVILDRKLFLIINSSNFFISLLLVVISWLSKRKLKTIIIHGLYALTMLSLLLSTIFIVGPNLAVAIYLMCIVSVFLMIWRKYDDIMKEAKYVSVLYDDVIKLMKFLKKSPNFKNNRLKIKRLVSIFSSNNKLSQAVLSSPSFTRKDRDLKNYLREKLIEAS